MLSLLQRISMSPALILNELKLNKEQEDNKEKNRISAIQLFKKLLCSVSIIFLHPTDFMKD